MEKITFLTGDGVTIAGEFAAPEPTEIPDEQLGRAALFLHMMPAAKESWRPLAERLNAAGFTTLAIDFRGHGESTVGPHGVKLDRLEFTDEQHQSKMRDVEAAFRWLMERGAVPARIAVVGASIGANLAIAFSGTHDSVPATVALSPGLDFRGVLTEPGAAAMPRSQKLLLVASKEDEYSYSSVQHLAAVKPDAELQLLEAGGHGTAMLDGVPGFFDYVAAWIENNVR